ncbi:baseplate J/gp47 family protein [Embleya sp. AB8]|uniref:baseplate J/gp47 family protein n=1 Tax=Embleya sp. AB8 TaxID=3156304 RepID=UPI003C752AE6
MSAPRGRADVVAALLAARTGWVPDWHPTPGGPSLGVAHGLGALLAALEERLAHLPDRQLAALLDMVGVSLLPAQGADGTVLLQPLPGVPGARVSAGSRLGATVPGHDAPLVFETQDTVALAGAPLVEVWSVDPGADAAADHSADVLARRPVTLFTDLRPTVRELYLAHETLLAFAGRATVEVAIVLRRPAATPLRLTWTWWDGSAWRPFAPWGEGDEASFDGTAGLTRSGTVRLVAPCATAVTTTVAGVEAYWLRARLDTGLSREPGFVVPELAHLRLSAVTTHARIARFVGPAGGAGNTVTIRTPIGTSVPAAVTLHVADATAGTKEDVPAEPGKPVTLAAAHQGHTVRFGVTVPPTAADTFGTGKDGPKPGVDYFPLDDPDDLTAPLTPDSPVHVDLTLRPGLAPDKAVADAQAVDLTRAFNPLGPAPVRGSAFHVACDAAFGKPGARVTLVIGRPRTAAEEADQRTGELTGGVQNAKDFRDKTVADIRAVASRLAELTAVTGALGRAVVSPLSGEDPVAWYTSVKRHIRDALTALSSAANAEPVLFTNVGSARDHVKAAQTASNPAADLAAASAALGGAPKATAGLLLATADVAGQLSAGASSLAAPRAALAQALASGTDAQVVSAHDVLASALATVLATPTPYLADTPLPSFLSGDPVAFVTDVTARINTAKAAVDTQVTQARTIADALANLSPEDLLKAVAGSQTPDQLTAPEVTWEYFDGASWRPIGAAGAPAVLALQRSGALHFTVPPDWARTDVTGDERRWLRARLERGSFSFLRQVSWTDKSGVLNFLPVVEPRPPVLDRFEVFYRHVAGPDDPRHTIALDDHTWTELTGELAFPGPGATPFRAPAEPGPTLYLGFDGELPADRLGLYVEPAGEDPDAVPVRPTWEGYDGTTWVTLATDDGTEGLTRTGVIGLLWPGTGGAPGAPVAGAVGRTVTLLGRGAAARFAPGDRLLLTDLRGGEPVTVAAAEGETLTLRDPLSRAFAGGELRAAPPARFGTPRTWIRAAFPAEADPPRAALTALVPNAAKVRQVQTITDELLGSADGSAAQVFQALRIPVLDGAVIEIRELDGDRAAVDLPLLQRELGARSAAALRTVADPRTGRVSQVWVRWDELPSLGLAGPGDRVYVCDHATGRVLFGGDGHGRVPPVGPDNVRLRSYRTGGGAVGNVPAGAITQAISAVAVGAVSNPRSASGGTDAESFPDVLRRGPALLRHRRLALTETDVAALARETVPAIAAARALGARDRHGRVLPGVVRLVVVPRDGTDRPEPTGELLRRVRDAVSARLPAAARLVVEGARYFPVGVSVTVRPARAGDAGPVRGAVLAALGRFLHPLDGGPTGTGWPFGRGVYLSDAARLLEEVAGVDVVTSLDLTVDGVPAGDVVTVDPDAVVCAGPLAVRLAGPAGSGSGSGSGFGSGSGSGRSSGSPGSPGKEF